jgi:hypothetical protein
MTDCSVTLAKKSLFVVIGFLFLSVIVSPMPALAAEGPCQADRKALCKDMKGQWRKCLAENMDKVSQGCKDHLASKTKLKIGGLKEACTAEIASKCPTQALGGGLKKCLKDQYDGLSEGCKAAVDGAKSGT